MAGSTFIVGDCVEAMAAMDPASVDAICTDPPYGLGFMGRDWDNLPPGIPWAKQCLRVLKPGGHLLAFGGTRTSHRLVCAIEDAGFEIRDTIAWMYGSGFPKSLDVSKAIDKRAEENSETTRRIAAVGAVVREYRARAGLTPQQVSMAVVGTPSGACWNWEHQQLPSIEMWPKIKATLAIPDDFDGLIEGDRARFIAAERAVLGLRDVPAGHAFAGPTYGGDSSARAFDVTAPATPDAERWDGWGTALKPSHEPIVVARKPLDGTVAANVLRHGTGAINVDGCRLEGAPDSPGTTPSTANGNGQTHGAMTRASYTPPLGRWPANVVLDEEAAIALDSQTGTLNSGSGPLNRNGDKLRTAYGAFAGGDEPADVLYGDSGGASRFFYVAKASSAERNAGLDGFEERDASERINITRGRQMTDLRMDRPQERRPSRNVHPTVKPIALMRWLVRLVTPPGGTVLDPFAGSGTTGCAAALEGFDFIGIEREVEYAAIAEARIAWWARHPDGMQLVRRLEMEKERAAVADAGQGSIFDLLGEAS